MATGRTASLSGITVENLQPAMRAMAKMSKDAAKEAKGILREQNKFIRDQAWKRAPGGAPGTYGISSKTKMITMAVNNKGASLRLLTGKGLDRQGRREFASWVNVMEFGESKSFIPINTGKGPGRGGRRKYDGRVGGAAQARPWKPPNSNDLRTNTGGYMLLPTFRKFLPKVEDEINDETVAWYNKTMRQSGVR